MNLPLNQILHTDALAGLKQLPDNCVDCCVTSPPYWGLRDYGVTGQLGLEKTPEEFIAKLVEIFHEVKRVLKPSGTCWVNMGDSYAVGGRDRTWEQANAKSTLGGSLESQTASLKQQNKVVGGLKPKDLVGIPWMLAFALRADGWWLRQDIIWHKPNPMPESCTDRCTKAHEYIFLLTKSRHYYYDAEAIKEDSIDGIGRSPVDQSLLKRYPTKEINGVRDRTTSYAKANKRSVWSITTQPYNEAHFATFPEELPALCIKAGSTEKGCCLICGEPWERVISHQNAEIRKSDRAALHSQLGRTQASGTLVKPAVNETTGWQPTCNCQLTSDDSQLTPGLILDPFMGAGTTAMVAAKLGRNFIGFELNDKYNALANKRLKKELGLFAHS